MDLTPKAQQSLDFSMACYRQGLCTTKEYLKAIKTIYQEDVKKQVEFLMDKGFKKMGAYKHIYNLDRGEVCQ